MALGKALRRVLRMTQPNVLPDDLPDLLRRGKIDEAKAVISRREVGARLDDWTKPTALHLPDCPDEIVRWLVERGEDINAEDYYGLRPLHMLRNDDDAPRARLLLDLGAQVDARDGKGRTPLMVAAGAVSEALVDTYIAAGARPDATSINAGREFSAITHALSDARSYEAPRMLRIVERLLSLGARPTGQEPRFLTMMGQNAHTMLAHARRDGREDTADLEDQISVLNRLCEILKAQPVAPVVLHDGTSPIDVPEGPSGRAFGALWDALVPPAGQADTAQGEAIRITGRIGDELLRNGGINWDDAYTTMADGLGELLASGTPLPPPDLARAREALAILRTGAMDELAITMMTELAVDWVRLNPQPVTNPLPDVGR